MRKNIISMAVLSSILVSSLFLIASCGDDEPSNQSNVAPTISVSPQQVTVGADQKQTTFNVLANVDWVLSCSDAWISTAPYTGGKKDVPTDIRVTMTANNSMQPRTAVIRLKGGDIEQTFTIIQEAPEKLKLSCDEYYACSEGETINVAIESNTSWHVVSDASWIIVDTPEGEGSGMCQLTVRPTFENIDRSAHVTIGYADSQTAKVTVKQYVEEIDVPDGFKLVWMDGFNDASADINDLWTYEVKNPGWVNNELQRYVAGELNGVKTAEIHDGMLTITALKLGDEVISARLNSNKGWKYGIIEGRLRLPSGKGTWPAFWMYPTSPEGNWPYCGEIDIMEEVGCVPDEVSSSIHCQEYNHMNQTQKTAARKIIAAEGEFHIYRLEWTEDYIRTYVDGVQLLYFPNDKLGKRETWPFDYDFKIILNLAWGGMWGGMWGVDEDDLPIKYDIDYIRVYQKK